MALEGIPGVSRAFKDFIPVVRAYTRDHPELNRLLAGVESDDRQIAWAILDALSDFNGTPPILGNFSLEALLDYSQQSLLLRMTTCALVESVCLLQTRNHLNYSTGGTTVGINDKTPLLMQWLQYNKSYTEQMKQRVKVAMNIQGLFGESGVHSELFAVNSTYAGY
jgi:hypothetical protein